MELTENFHYEEEDYSNAVRNPVRFTGSLAEDSFFFLFNFI